MWTILKYVVDSPNPENKEVPEPVNESTEDVGFEQVLNTIKGEIQKNAENYVISLHYLDVPIVLHFGVDKLKETRHLKIYRERLDETKEVRKILLMNEDDYVQGFLFLRKQVAVQKDILNSLDLDTFDKKASESGFEPYIINDLRTIWKNKRLESLQAALAHHVDTYYKPKLDHPLCEAFVTYLENIYKRGVDHRIPLYERPDIWKVLSKRLIIFRIHYDNRYQRKDVLITVFNVYWRYIPIHQRFQFSTRHLIPINII